MEINQYLTILTLQGQRKKNTHTTLSNLFTFIEIT